MNKRYLISWLLLLWGTLGMAQGIPAKQLKDAPGEGRVLYSRDSDGRYKEILLDSLVRFQDVSTNGDGDFQILIGDPAGSTIDTMLFNIDFCNITGQSGNYHTIAGAVLDGSGFTSTGNDTIPLTGFTSSSTKMTEANETVTINTNGFLSVHATGSISNTYAPGQQLSLAVYKNGARVSNLTYQYELHGTGTTTNVNQSVVWAGAVSTNDIIQIWVVGGNTWDWESGNVTFQLVSNY